MNLSQALRLTPCPCIALTGAGGKTTALFKLAHELSSSNNNLAPVLVTTSTHLGAWQIPLAEHHIIEDQLSNLAQQPFSRGVTLVTGALDGDRAQGVSVENIERLHEYCQRHQLPLLIEADGSRQRPLKAPAEYEPVIPEWVDMVIVVAGLTGLGNPLTEAWVHRPKQLAKLSNSAEGELITPEIIASVLKHPQGGLKNIPPKAQRVVLLNQADNAELQAQANKLVRLLLPDYHSVIIAALDPPSSRVGEQPHSNGVRGKILSANVPVAGIILAAGESKRLGRPKQLLDYHGQSFTRTVAQIAIASELNPVVVVTGAFAEEVDKTVRNLPVHIANNVDWKEGQSTSLQTGLRALPSETGAAIFLLIDQPQITTGLVRSLVEHHAVELHAIVAPLVNGQRANPVLFDRRTFPDLLALQGDVGGRAIFHKHPVAYLPWLDESILLDIDTEEDYQRYSRD